MGSHGARRSTQHERRAPIDIGLERRARSCDSGARRWTMSLVTGTNACTSGLAKRVYDNVVGEFLQEMQYDLAQESAETQQMWKLLSYSVAKGVVDEIQANAAIDAGVATIDSQTGGLQQYNDPDMGPTDTNPPTSEKTIPVTGGIT
jgi:hypothetical protein